MSKHHEATQPGIPAQHLATLGGNALGPYALLGEELASTHQLSPELAQDNPGQYLSTLLELAGAQTTHTIDVMNEAGKRGLMRSLTIAPDEYFSSTGRAGGVEIGAKPYPADKRLLRLIGPARRGGDHEKVGALSHELSHQILYVDDQLPETITLLDRLTRNHREGHGGLTSMSMAPIYAEREVEINKPEGSIRGQEDLVELMGLYLQDPEELSSYLVFLNDPQQQARRGELGLLTLSIEDSQDIHRTVERTIEHFLAVAQFKKINQAKPG